MRIFATGGLSLTNLGVLREAKKGSSQKVEKIRKNIFGFKDLGLYV
jgi:hypothetical protein